MQVKNEVRETAETQDGEGRYTDAFRIGHSAYKFVFDFGQLSSSKGKVHFHTRIIMGPDNARALIATLVQSLREHEEQFWKITQSDELENFPTPAPFGSSLPWHNKCRHHKIFI